MSPTLVYRRPFVLAIVLLAASILGAITLGPMAHAADCSGIQTSIVTCSETKDTTGSPVVSVLVVVIQVLTGLIGVAAIGALIYAGILYSSASGNAAQVAKAKEIITNTLIGLAIFALTGVGLNYLIPGDLFSGSAAFGAGGNGQGNIIAKNLDFGNPANPDSDSSEITSTNPYSLTFASWNTYVNNTKNKGAAVRTILSSADVLGMQEVHKLAQRKDIQSVESSSIGIHFASEVKGNSSSQLSYPIAYNKTKLTYLNGGYKEIGKTPGLSERYVVYARFRVKATGQEFYFANTHLPPSVEKGGEPNTGSNTLAAYKKQMSVLVSTMKQLGAKGVPVFLTGDFNVNYRKEDCHVTFFPCKALRGANMKSGFEYTQLAGIPKSLGTHADDSRIIDYVFVRTDSRVKVNGTKILGGSSCTNRRPDPDCYYGSDHRPSLTTVTITSTDSTSIPNNGTPASSPSAVSLKSVRNFRDLALINPTLVRPGVIYRSEKLQNASASDGATLSRVLKNGVIIDLRTKDKHTSQPDRSISGVPNINYDVNAAGGASQYVKVFVNDKTERLEFGAALTKIANTQGAALIHCTYGKDRTGWLASMILYIVGANDTQVMAEYLKSRDAGSTYNVDASWLNAALSAARKNNGGSIMNYIKSSSNGLGVSDATITKLKAKVGA